ncbi:MAG: hypothetical protein ACE5JG_06730 [Planctomycetota bacterium]
MNRLLALLLAGSAVAGCASVEELPAHWDQAVRRETPHFLLETDLPAREADPILAAAEDVYGEYRYRFGAADGGESARIRLLVFREAYDYARFLGLRVPSRREFEEERQEIEAKGYRVLGTSFDVPRGHFDPSHAPAAPVIGLPQAVGIPSVLRHELAHYFVRLQDPAPPAWLDEGVAEYLRLVGSRREPGRITTKLRRAHDAGAGLTLRALRRMSHGDFRRREELAYPTAWLLLRHLIEEARALSLKRLRERDGAERLLETLTVEDLLRGAESRAASWRGAKGAGARTGAGSHAVAAWTSTAVVSPRRPPRSAARSRARRKRPGSDRTPVIRTPSVRARGQYPAAWPSLRDSEAP